MSKRFIKRLICFICLFGGLLLARLAFAQDFGTEAVNNGLANSLTTTDVRTVIGRIINVFLGVLGLVAIIIILWSGYLWMVSGGDEDKIAKAKRHLRNGVIGLIIILAAWAITIFIFNKLGGAVNGGGCIDGEAQSCGCYGTMTCSGGSWGPCEGSNCGGCTNCGQTSCDGNAIAGCQAVPQMCDNTDYCDSDDCSCKPRGEVGDPCSASGETCEPDNGRCADYLTCDQNTCTCYGPPVITEISPAGGFCQEDANKACTKDSDCSTICNTTAPNGATDNLITIFGKNFGEYSATSSQVVFVGSGSGSQLGRDPKELNPACVSSWTNTQIVIAVPSNVTTGPVKVTNKDSLSDQTDDGYGPKIDDFEANSIARPGLCYIDPNRGVLSSSVGYQGVNLYSGDAYFGNYKSNVRGLDSEFDNPSGLSGTSTTPNIKTGDSGSFVINDINGNKEKSNYLKFVKDQEPGESPYIFSFGPTKGSAGQYVTIFGSGFGGARGSSKVYFGDTEAAYNFPEICLNSVWKNNQIIVKVPAGLADGNHVIKVDLGSVVIDTQKLNPNSFQMDKNLALKTSLCKIDPIRGPIATPVTLWGEYFGKVGQSALIKFNYDRSATGTIAKDGQADQVKAAVPAESISGPVRVLKGGEWGNELNFEVGSCTVKADCGTQVCCPAATYKHGRCVDVLEDCFIDVPTSVFEWSFSTGFGTSTNFFSCAGMSKYLGSCYQGALCPNSPGACSSPSQKYEKVVGNCDSDCQTVPGCTISSCSYNQAIDKCVNGNCDLPQTISLGVNLVQKTCNSDGQWEITTKESCPVGWTRTTNDRCIENNSQCNICASDFTCQAINSLGYCVSDKLCAEKGSRCSNDKCIVEVEPTCDCCCRIGHDSEDCCAGLKCTGRCGSDLAESNGTIGTCCNATGSCLNPSCSAIGGIVSEVGGNCIHVFRDSGILEVSNPLDAKVLVVGGGGGAGGGKSNYVYDAGGGGGEVIEKTITIPIGNIQVNVGHGGTSISGYSAVNTDGGDSSILSVVASGGKKAAYPGTGGMSGSGKIGGKNNGYGSGGGAGDSQNGFNAPSNEKGGNGGNGTYSNITGVSIAYGGGGEGNSFGGSGIGGAGYKNPGGGGTSQTGVLGNEEAQPGIVIIKYPSVPATTCPAGYSNTSNTFGNCSGCGLIGTSQEEHDNACNCTGHSGKYCDISDAHPEGICTDCSNLSSQANCNSHSSVCCVDANRTSTTTDDICRGGDGRLVSGDPNNSDYGYCAYYDCQSANPKLCATSTPAKLALYKGVDECVSGCANNPGADYCSTFNGNQSACSAESVCCFDKKSSTCKSGAKIESGHDKGYCAYYDCRDDNPKLCNFTATTTGRFVSTSTCAFRCANEEGGAGLVCNNATSTCNFDVCNLENFSCLTASGTPGIYPSCGSCCCQPVGVGGNATDTCTLLNPKLQCLADKGNCSGANRGLCCGCTADSDCGHPATIGCGSDTCCQARPEIASTSPEHLDDNVCRNAVVKVNFTQNMDAVSFNNNVLLLEERDYGTGVCPAGTFVAAQGTMKELLASQDQGFLARLGKGIKSLWHRLTKTFSDRAIATTPDPSKLYCAIPGSVSAEENGDATTLVFAPVKLLSPAANYYLVVLGDEGLDSQSGVLSSAGIGFNGDGYFDESANAYVPGGLIKFNNQAYKNSQIIKFTTLSDQSSKGGVCVIDHVASNPTSYLFKTTDNSLDENDTDVNNKTFDTKADKDKVFSAWAYSTDGQAIQPVTGYYWDWTWQVDDTGIAALTAVSGLGPNRAFAVAQSGVTDSETKLRANVDMGRFLDPACDNSANCACDSNNCSNNCCNAYSTGDDLSTASDLFVFICNNPWPPVASNGVWSPWSDTCQGSIGGPCVNYNYKFYYCRDYGNANTLDDLPAIIDSAIIRGQSSSLVCSADKTPCSNLNGLCGPDKNGDGNLDGLCLWNVLKESYFFRETILPGGEITAATDKQTSGEVQVNWRSDSSQVGSYKVYYLKSGQGAMSVKEVVPSEACNLLGTVYDCQTTISALTNNISYVFKVSVISVNKTESQLSNEKKATPTDKIPPTVPVGLKAQIIASSTVKFSWDANSDDTVFYRLYHGINPGQYGESFDSASKATSLTLGLSELPAGDNYFALSALDAFANESAKGGEITVSVPSN